MNQVEKYQDKVKSEGCLKDFLYITLITFLVTALLTVSMKSWYGLNINYLSGTDMRAYLDNAIGIINGNWPGEQPFYRAPLFSYILAGMIYVGKTMLGAQIIQCFIFSLTNGIILLSTQILFNRLTGWISSIILLFYGAVVFWVLILHSAVFELFFATVTLFAFILLRNCLVSEKNNRVPAFAYSIFFAVSFALLCLIRPNFLISGIVLFLILFMELCKKRKLKLYFFSAFITCLICLSVWSPVGIHNYIYSGTPITGNASVTFNDANTEGSGVYNAMTPIGKQLSPYTLKFWTHQLKKALAYLQSPEYPQNVCYYLFKNSSFLLKLLFIPFGFIVALFLIGIILNCDLIGKLWPCYAFFFPYYLSICFFHIVGRFRIPALAPMLIIAAITLYRLYTLFRDRRYGRFAVFCAAFLILFILLNPFKRIIKDYSYRSLALTAMMNGKYSDADRLLKTNENNLVNAELLVSSYLIRNDIHTAYEYMNRIVKSRNYNKNKYLHTQALFWELLGKENKSEIIKSRIPENYSMENDRIYSYYIFIKKLQASMKEQNIPLDKT